MVTVPHSVAAHVDPEQYLRTLAEGLGPEEARRLGRALEFAAGVYGDATLGSSERVISHALGMALIIAGLKLDGDARAAALLFAVPTYDEHAIADVEERFGKSVGIIVGGISRLNRLRPMSHAFIATGAETQRADSGEQAAQIEVLRKMLLAMVEDIRVVLLRLASRTQTLRYYAASPHDQRETVARETLAIYSPLANRLGVWELKWELEDLAFRFLHPETYKKVAGMLDESRAERERFIADAVSRLRAALVDAGVTDAEIYGRPKHIYSIWNKMRRKGLEFSEIHDVRALRVIVPDIKDCYNVLGIVHALWAPIPAEFDDYISHPKDNHYRSLHTAVSCADRRALEVQIRTRDMHRHAELGVAAHWRYKEGTRRAPGDTYDDKIAWLRQLLTWKAEVTDSTVWAGHLKQAALDDTRYVLTPQGKVLDLPAGSTPVDFAYRLHTDLGHRCRGAKVDGQLVPLNTELATGQRVEIITVRQGGPSRDWLNPGLRYLKTKGARSKVRQWFSNLALEETLLEGRTVVTRELQRLGHTGVNIEALAHQLSYAKADDLYLAAARGEMNLRQFQAAARGDDQDAGDSAPETIQIKPSKSGRGAQGVLIVGVDNLLTQLARCCKPAPPDAIHGFVTRGKGVSIHRRDCPNFASLAASYPERLIETDWGGKTQGMFAVDLVVDAHDRQGLLHDISDIFTHESVNVVAVQSQSRHGKAHMGFTVDVTGLEQVNRALALIHDVAGVVSARRV
jgi:GTP pyrophosphokinase